MHYRNLLHLSINVSVTLISSTTIFFPSIGITQSDPACFLINSEGKVINLNKLCQNQTSQKASVCEGPFDEDGFPKALYPELKRLQAATAKLRQNQFDSEDSEMQVAALEYQSAMESLMSKIPSRESAGGVTDSIVLREDRSEKADALVQTTTHIVQTQTSQEIAGSMSYQGSMIVGNALYPTSEGNSSEEAEALRVQMDQYYQDMNTLINREKCYFRLMEAFDKKLAEERF